MLSTSPSVAITRTSKASALSQLFQKALDEQTAYSLPPMLRMNLEVKTVLVRMKLPRCMGDLPPSQDPAVLFFGHKARAVIVLCTPSLG